MSSRYQTIPIIKSDTGITSTSGKDIYSPTYYPDIDAKEDDSYIQTSTTDRLDIIAYDFYSDASLWWVIAMVNNLPGDSMFPPIGGYLRIPRNIADLLAQYQSSNL
tara:strand:- start:390 stop:707 length:318 start_codon:yes stop_codon:yes gene_type:complete